MACGNFVINILWRSWYRQILSWLYRLRDIEAPNPWWLWNMGTYRPHTYCYKQNEGC